MRELSRLEVREELIPTGGTRSIHELSSGSILVNVARRLLRRGDEVQIRTPNAVAAVRGSTILAQYNPALTQTIFVLLTGSAFVVPLGGPVITLAANTSITISGTAATGVQWGSVETITQAEAKKILEESEVRPARTAESAGVQFQEAARLTIALLGEPPAAAIETATLDAGIEPVTLPTLSPCDVTPELCEEGGLLAQAATSAQAAAEELPFIFQTDTTSSRSPFFQVTNETLNVSDNLILVESGVSVNLAGQLLAVDPSTITTGGDIIEVNSGASLTLGGPLFTDVAGIFDIGSRFLLVRDGSRLTSTTTSPLITLSGSTVDAERTFVTLSSSTSSASTLILDGPLLDATNSIFEMGDPNISELFSFIFVADSSTLKSTSSDPLVTLNPSTLTATGNFLNVRRSGIVDLAGPLLSDTESTFTVDQFVRVREGSTFASSSSDPLIQLSASTVNAEGDFMRIDESANVTLSGSLLSAANSSFSIGPSSARRNFIDVRNSGSSFKSTSSNSLVTLNPSTVTTRRFLTVLDSATMELAGPVLKDTGSTFITNRDFAAVHGLASFIGSGPDPLFQFSNSSITIGPDGPNNFFLVNQFAFGGVDIGPATVTLAGPLVSDSGSSFSIADRLLRVSGGSTLSSTSGSPLITLSDSEINTGVEFVRVDNSANITLSGHCW